MVYSESDFSILIPSDKEQNVRNCIVFTPEERCELITNSDFNDFMLALCSGKFYLKNLDKFFFHYITFTKSPKNLRLFLDCVTNTVNKILPISEKYKVIEYGTEDFKKWKIFSELRLAVKRKLLIKEIEQSEDQSYEKFVGLMQEQIDYVEKLEMIIRSRYLKMSEQWEALSNICSYLAVIEEYTHGYVRGYDEYYNYEYVKIIPEKKINREDGRRMDEMNIYLINLGNRLTQEQNNISLFLSKHPNEDPDCDDSRYRSGDRVDL